MPQLADAHYDLGVALVARGETLRPSRVIGGPVKLKPSYTQAWNNLAILLREEGKVEEAMAACRNALRIRQDVAEVHSNMGLILASQGLLAEAEESHRQSIRCKPDFAEGHNNLGIVLRDQGKLDEGLLSYNEAIRLSPGYADAHLNRSLLWLVEGDYLRGWQEYEWRWKKADFPPRPFHQPQWDGSSLAGRTTLLHAEQGLGDTMQFIRFAPLVKQQGGCVILECQKVLYGLLTPCAGFDRLIARDDPLPDFDVQAPFMSLPTILKITLSRPAGTGPLPLRQGTLDRALAARAAKRSRLQNRHRLEGKSSLPGRPVSFHRAHGFCTAGPGKRCAARKPAKGEGAEQLPDLTCRSRHLGFWQPAGRDVHGHGRSHEEPRPGRHRGHGHRPPGRGPGRPGLAVAPPVADWRWLVGGEESPWYPSLRVIRQKRLGEWGETFDRPAPKSRECKAGRVVSSGERGR